MLVVLGTELPALRSADDVVRRDSYARGPGVAFEALQRPGVCSPSRWGPVTDEARRALRGSVARWMRARTAPAVDPLGPPEDSARRGCLFCGVSRADPWEAITVPTRALNGRPSSAPIEGGVCDPCAAAVQAVGSVGRTAMPRAILTHLGVARGVALESVELHRWAR